MDFDANSELSAAGTSETHHKHVEFTASTIVTWI